MDIQQTLTSAIEAYRASYLEKAKKLFQTVVLASPLDSDPHSFLGLIAIQNNEPNIAIPHFIEAIRLNPNNPLHHANLAGAFLQIKQPEDALASANNALKCDPDYPAALLSLGAALLSLGRHEESKAPLQCLLMHYPDHVEGLCSLGTALLRLKNFDDAERNLSKAIALCPSHTGALLNLAICLSQNERNQETSEICERILEINPKQIAARFLLCSSLLRDIYKDEDEIDAIRSRYESELIALRYLCDHATSKELSQAVFAVGLSHPFLLAYQGRNDRYLQGLYGEIIAKLMMARYPKWERKLSLRNRTHGERIRVGFVSGFFKNHSNWKTHLRGWIKQINRNDFALYGYHTGNEGKIAEEARTYLERLTVGPKTLKEYCSIIKDDCLDVLIFPEIGMDSMTLRLATLRLAPIQCTSWGHPNTSGLQTIDYFLSSALMEPSDGDAYYTESLIHLPNLSIYYEPKPIPFSPRKRADFGLMEDAILYWCCQIPIKYHPRYDEVFVKIARDVPKAKLVFIESLPTAAKQFRTRLEKTFTLFGLAADDYCIFLPRLSSEDFDAATNLMDIFLDSIGWSGCNSTLESLVHNLPIVTFPESTMRSRHTAAIFAMMGMEDCIATSLDDYIARAISLGRHSEERLQMSARIAANKQLIYRDDTTILGLENFLKSVAN